MSWVVAAAVLAATLEPEPDLARQPEVAIWAQPLGLIALAFTNSGNRMVFVSAGLTVAGPRGVELATELTGWESYSSYGPDGNIDRRFAGMLAIGPVFHTGSERFCGFFVEPKLVLEFGAASFQDEFPVRRWNFGSVQLGATAGWQVRWRSLYLALSLGATAGIGNSPGGANGPLFPGGSRGSVGFQWGLDLNLLRIGVAL